MDTTTALPVETPAHPSQFFGTARHSYRVPADPATDDTLMGLPVTVYRRGDGLDATWHGISATFDRLVIVGTIDLTDPRNRAGLPAVAPFANRTWRHGAVAPFFRGYATAPAALVRRRMGLDEHLVHVEPVTFDPDTGLWRMAHPHTMFGGNYVAGDSRFSELAANQLGHSFYGAIPVHDRVEK